MVPDLESALLISGGEKVGDTYTEQAALATCLTTPKALQVRIESLQKGNVPSISKRSPSKRWVSGRPVKAELSPFSSECILMLLSKSLPMN